MKAATLVLPLLISSTVNAAAIGRKDENFNKRAVDYVTITSTTQIPVSQYLAAATATAANVKVAAVATTAAATTTSTSGRFLSWLSGLFGSDDSSSSSAAVVVPSSTAIAYAATSATLVEASTAAAVATTTEGYFASLLDDLINPDTLTYTYPGGSVATGASGATASVNVGYTASASVSASGSSYTSSSSSGSGDSGDYALNIKYAEQAKGITYSPYNKDNLCKSASTVASDIAKLSSYLLIRLYSVDCSGVENVLAAINSNQQLFLGIWDIDSSSVQSGLETILSAVSSSSRGWDVVHTISIGNEQVNAGLATVAQVQAGVTAARTWLKLNAASYSGYVVTVDTLAATVADSSLCDVLDYIAVNCHPYFTGSVSPSEAGSWLQSQISSVSSVCGGLKSVLITETGWPTQGDSIGSCVPSIANQAEALESIMSLVGDQAFSFTMYNDYWKDPGPYNIEQYWGIYGDPSS